MRCVWVLLLICCSAAGYPAEISGRVYLKDPPPRELCAGYVGRDAKGHELNCLVGAGVDWGSSASDSCDTCKPRTCCEGLEPAVGQPSTVGGQTARLPEGEFRHSGSGKRSPCKSS